MIKKGIRLVGLILFFAGMVIAVHLKQKTITKKNERPIVSFSSEWKEKGKPVHICKIVPLEFNNKIKMTISCKDNQLFCAYVSKELFDKLKEDSLILFDVDNTHVKGSIKSLKNVVDKYTGLYRVEGLLHTGLNLPKSNYIAEVYAGKEPDAMMLPLEAVETTKDGSYVWLVKDNQCSKVKITVKEQKGENVFIQEGVISGDFVVVKGGRDLKEKDRVNIINVGEK